jgi:hypothetical protein
LLRLQRKSEGTHTSPFTLGGAAKPILKHQTLVVIATSEKRKYVVDSKEG